MSTPPPAKSRALSRSRAVPDPLALTLQPLRLRKSSMLWGARADTLRHTRGFDVISDGMQFFLSHQVGDQADPFDFNGDLIAGMQKALRLAGRPDARRRAGKYHSGSAHRWSQPVRTHRRTCCSPDASESRADRQSDERPPGSSQEPPGNPGTGRPIPQRSGQCKRWPSASAAPATASHRPFPQ